MITVLPDVQTANPGFIFETLLAYQRTAALRAAIEINLFGALGAGPAGSVELAQRCGVSERGARILCDYLTTIGLIEKEGSTYRHSPTSGAFLDPRSPASMASIVRLLTNFLHHFDEATCVGLLRKVRAALAPGGITATLEFVPNEDRVSPIMAAQFSMMMLGTTVKGDAYTLRDLERMHLAAGFAGLAPDVIPVGAQTVVIARTQ